QQQAYQPDAAETQTRMEQSVKRTVTLVFWYKALTAPLRLYQEIATFPMFSLSQFTQLVADLGLQPNSYVDAYNPQAGTWEQQTITTVRVVESEQRLLFRSRKSLLEGLADKDCPSLDSEIRMQPQILQNVQMMSPPQKSLKRPMPDTLTDVPLPAAKQFRPSIQSPFTMNQNNGPTQAFQSPSSSSPVPHPHLHQSLSPSMHPGSPFARQDVIMSQQPVDQPLSSTTITTESTPLHPTAKRWPNDFHVSEISAGFDKMDDIISQTPSLTQKVAFERVFGCRYVKSTVCRHRGVWKRADKNLKESFKRMGTGERALWGEFVKKTDFRREGQ
ncbi:hypothetical protein BC835DRAFT_1222667, partial [Cytidiella melzeri]